MSHPRITVQQVVDARKLLGWSRAELAARSGASERTLSELEADTLESPKPPRVLLALQTALEAAEVEFPDGSDPRARLP